MHRRGKFISFDYLKGVAITLIILMHAIVAYSSFGSYGPVESPGNIIIFDYIVAFIDSFAIPTLFLISGFFVLPSLKKHGAKGYIKERLIKLGIPWVLGLGIENLLQMTGTKIGFYGPLWFLMVLIFFDFFAILIYLVISKFGSKIKPHLERIYENPSLFFLALLTISGLGYLTMLQIVPDGKWVSFGPIMFDSSRILLHFAFFIMGVSIGHFGLKQTIFSPDNKSKRFWLVWLIIGTVFMILRMRYSPIFFPFAMVSLVLSCTGFFNSYFLQKNKILQSISRNDYGIYITHFVFVTGLQYVFVGIAIPAALKGILVFIFAVALSWVSTILLRKIPLVREVI